MANIEHTTTSAHREVLEGVTPYAHLSTDDLLREVFSAGDVDPLMLELAHRLEVAEYAN